MADKFGPMALSGQSDHGVGLTGIDGGSNGDRSGKGMSHEADMANTEIPKKGDAGQGIRHGFIQVCRTED